MKELDSIVFPAAWSSAYRGDALILVPPFCTLAHPPLGPHILQACARQAGFEVRVLYANLSFAALIGEENHEADYWRRDLDLPAERLFVRSAYGLPALGRHPLSQADPPPSGRHARRSTVEPGELRALEATAAAWCEKFTAAVAKLDFDVIGCTGISQQRAAGVALLGGVKARRPGVLTILGGSHCRDDMAEGVLALSPAIDYVFSGESERSFVEFLADLRRGCLPPVRVIRGEPCVDLDGIPTPDFSDFFEQLRVFLPKSAYIDDQSVMLAYESSRGCPWGQTQPCTFCGSKRATMTFRRKSARRVAEELRHLSKTHASNKLSFMDDCVPAALPRQLVDELNGEPPLCMIAATRATLSLSDVIALGKTGFVALVVGVEALCPSLLEHMNKGVSAPQNINLLRYARSVGLPIPWTLLFGFPGDEARQYEQTLSYLPLLRHLHPPHSLEPVQILRFSAYWKDPARYAVRNLRPPAAYASVLPEHVDPATVALRFEADYPSESCTDSALIGRLGDEVARWQRTWMSDGSPPVLEVAPVAQDRFLLADTRGLPGTQQFSFLNRRRASLILAGSCLDDAENVAWALERKLLLEMDSSLVPLATATPQVLQEFV